MKTMICRIHHLCTFYVIIYYCPKHHNRHEDFEFYLLTQPPNNLICFYNVNYSILLANYYIGLLALSILSPTNTNPKEDAHRPKCQAKPNKLYSGAEWDPIRNVLKNNNSNSI